MPSTNSPSSIVKASYFGIGACVLFVIATSMIFFVIAINWNAEYKLAGFELIVIGPFSYLLYFVGICFATAGLRKPNENSGSYAGLILNIIPFVYLVSMFCFAVLNGKS